MTSTVVWKCFTLSQGKHVGCTQWKAPSFVLVLRELSNSRLPLSLCPPVGIGRHQLKHGEVDKQMVIGEEFIFFPLGEKGLQNVMQPSPKLIEEELGDPLHLGK